MANITAQAVTPVSGAYSATPYSGTFIPTIWSAKLNAKFYAASVVADITNRNWEGDVSNLGDKVIINNIPDITISDYAVGTSLNYQTPTPSTVELALDRGKAFAFNVSDVFAYQSKPDLMDTFTNDASEQLRIAVDSAALYRAFHETMQSSVPNKGSNAGRRTGSFALGTDTSPIVINSTPNDAANILTKILQLSAVLDEQDVPETGRWLLVPPYVRTMLMNTNIGSALVMGDDRSPVRNGMIGMIDRFKIYVTNNLPRNATGSSTPWVSGDGTESYSTATGTVTAKGVVIAGHSSAIAFASQVTKTETLRNPSDFGDIVRGLQIFGAKLVKPESIAVLKWA